MEHTFPFIETIKVKNGKAFYLEDHQKRMEASVRFCFGADAPVPSLAASIRVPDGIGDRWYKCRVVYGKTIHSVEYEPYKIKTVKKLILREAPGISYNLKWRDRSALDQLKDNTEADDIIITQNGLITDGSFANLLFLKDGIWYTPDTPLLPGTQRARLLRDKKIVSKRISVNDLKAFEKVKWINAMLDMKDGPEWPIEIIANLP